MSNTNGSPFVFNAHGADCGQPPCIVTDPAKYHGYYSNQHGEQWVFQYDPNTGLATLRGGDIGWDVVHKVVDGDVSGLILGLGERAWLSACWHAVSCMQTGTD